MPLEHVLRSERWTGSGLGNVQMSITDVKQNSIFQKLT